MGPARFLATTLGTDAESVIRWLVARFVGGGVNDRGGAGPAIRRLILLIVLGCDPEAIALTSGPSTCSEDQQLPLQPHAIAGWG